MSVDEFLSKFQRQTWLLEYNGIVKSPKEICSLFMTNLGHEFTPLRTSPSLGPKWKTDDIKILTRLASNYLAQVTASYDINKQQKDHSKSTTSAPPDPKLKTTKKTLTTSNTTNTPMTLQDIQKAIFREIGTGIHTTARVNHWK